MSFLSSSCGSINAKNDIPPEKDLVEISIKKTLYSNPVTKLYGGDPSAFVDGDKVYLYTGHDVSTKEEISKAIYNIPEYLCYSTTDMINWTEEGVVMSMDTVSWASNDTSAWASQVVKHYDKELEKERYYLYFCSWDKTGKQSIGVAVSDSPTGPFTDIGKPLVRASLTKPDLSSFNDIDPTVWVETDENGTEHRYLAWGNGVFFICELNEDMVSLKDLNDDGKITCGLKAGEDDILKRTAGLENYTEAPWLYRRSDENGQYFGPYYLFFAHEWRESIAYATTDDLMSGKWSGTKRIMYPTATSNTNHPAVIDYQGKTYFIGHNGALPGGNGYRRSVTVQELFFEEDGSIKEMEETSQGLSKEAVSIRTSGGNTISHAFYINSSADADYPYDDVPIGADIGSVDADALWIIHPGKADSDNKSFVSIESENKPGLFMTVNEKDEIVLAQDTDASEDTFRKQTFVTKGISNDAEHVVFESVYAPGKYIVLSDGLLKLGKEKDDSVSAQFLIVSE